MPLPEYTGYNAKVQTFNFGVGNNIKKNDIFTRYQQIINDNKQL